MLHITSSNQTSVYTTPTKALRRDISTRETLQESHITPRNNSIASNQSSNSKIMKWIGQLSTFITRSLSKSPARANRKSTNEVNKSLHQSFNQLQPQKFVTEGPSQGNLPLQKTKTQTESTFRLHRIAIDTSMNESPIRKHETQMKGCKEASQWEDTQQTDHQKDDQFGFESASGEGVVRSLFGDQIKSESKSKQSGDISEECSDRIQILDDSPLIEHFERSIVLTDSQIDEQSGSLSYDSPPMKK